MEIAVKPLNLDYTVITAGGPVLQVVGRPQAGRKVVRVHGVEWKETGMWSWSWRLGLETHYSQRSRSRTFGPRVHARILPAISSRDWIKTMTLWKCMELCYILSLLSWHTNVLETRMTFSLLIDCIEIATWYVAQKLNLYARSFKIPIPNAEPTWKNTVLKVKTDRHRLKLPTSTRH